MCDGTPITWKSSGADLIHLHQRLTVKCPRSRSKSAGNRLVFRLLRHRDWVFYSQSEGQDFAEGQDFKDKLQQKQPRTVPQLSFSAVSSYFMLQNHAIGAK